MRRRWMVLLVLLGGCSGEALLGGQMPDAAPTSTSVGEDGGDDDVVVVVADGSVVVVDGGVDAPSSTRDSGPPPSCAPGGPGMTNCGGSNGTDDCCATLLVAGGTFFRSYENDGGPSNLADPATVSSFYLDKYPVTVGRFRQFVQAWDGGAGYLPPAGSGKHDHLNGGLGLVGADGAEHETGWQSSYDSSVAPTDANLVCLGNHSSWKDLSPPLYESVPMNCVNWFEAYAFCIWDGGFLPSEAEWAYVAAGGSEQRAYAWGSTPPGYYSQYAIYGCYNDPVCLPAWVGMASKGISRWGQLDVVGNIQVWTADWTGPYATPCVDCARLTTMSSTYRTIRGEAYGGGPLYLNPAYRPYPYEPHFRDGAVGFRCARSP